MTRRQKSSRCSFMSSTMTLAPVSLTNSSVARPMGPAPMIRHDSLGLGAAAVDGVTADGQRLHQGQLLEGQLARDVQLAGRHEELRPQSAVAVDAQRLVLLAAVGVAAPAGVTLLAVDVRLDRAAVARPDVGSRPAPTSSTSTPSSWPGMRG